MALSTKVSKSSDKVTWKEPINSFWNIYTFCKLCFPPILFPAFLKNSQKGTNGKKYSLIDDVHKDRHQRVRH